MDIREIAVAAVEELVAWHTVGIVGDAGSGPGSGIGTGTAVSRRGLNLILTAKHVVESSPPEALKFLFRPPGNIERASIELPQSPLTGGLLFTQNIEITKLKLSETDDLAALYVSPQIADVHNVRFHHLDSDGVAPSAGTRIMFTGFPAALAQQVAGTGRAAFRSIAYQTILEQDAFDDFDPERNFASDYTFGKKPVEPMGFSGGAAWFDSGTDAMVWTAGLGFAGVLTAYHRKKQIIEGIRVEVVREFLSSLV